MASWAGNVHSTHILCCPLPQQDIGNLTMNFLFAFLFLILFPAPYFVNISFASLCLFANLVHWLPLATEHPSSYPFPVTVFCLLSCLPVNTVVVIVGKERARVVSCSPAQPGLASAPLVDYILLLLSMAASIWTSVTLASSFFVQTSHQPLPLLRQCSCSPFASLVESLVSSSSRPRSQFCCRPG